MVCEIFMEKDLIKCFLRLAVLQFIFWMYVLENISVINIYITNRALMKKNCSYTQHPFSHVSFFQFSFFNHRIYKPKPGKLNIYRAIIKNSIGRFALVFLSLIFAVNHKSFWNVSISDNITNYTYKIIVILIWANNYFTKQFKDCIFF